MGNFDKLPGKFTFFKALHVRFHSLCSTQEILVSTKIKFNISLVLKKSCLRKLATSPRKLLYSLAAIRL